MLSLALLAVASCPGLSRVPPSAASGAIGCAVRTGTRYELPQTSIRRTSLTRRYVAAAIFRLCGSALSGSPVALLPADLAVLAACVAPWLLQCTELTAGDAEP